MFLSLFLTLIPTLLAPPAHTGDYELRHLARLADVIFLGQVEEVSRVYRQESDGPPPKRDQIDFDFRSYPLVAIARVKVQRAYKGVAAGEVAYYPANSWFIDDVTTAIPGETAFFFLARSNWAEPEGPLFRATLNELTGGSPTHKLLHSGRGRLPIHTKDSVEYAVFHEEVLMPSNLPTLPAPEAEFSSSQRLVEKDALERQLQAIVAAQQLYFRAANQTPLSADRKWSLELWGDGFRRLHLEKQDEILSVDKQIPLEQLEALKQAFSDAQKLGWPRTLGQQGPGGSHRTLEIRVAYGSTHRLDIYTVFPELIEDPALRRQAASVLSLWSELRGLFATPMTLDARPCDQRCLEAWQE